MPPVALACRRLRSLAEDLGTQTESNSKLRGELSESRRKAEDQQIGLAKLRKECATAKADNDALRQSGQDVPPELLVAESARAHSCYSSKQVQKSC